MSQQSRLIVASNRLPIILNKTAAGAWNAEPASGGLVSALMPVLQHRGGLWIGWPGISDGVGSDLENVFDALNKDNGYTFKPVLLSADEVEDFYQGFSNEIIWPLFHDMPSRCNFEPRYWHSYSSVNQRFASVIKASARADDFIWVHDYHLMELARELKAAQVSAKTGFFLHIPFPPLDIFLKLPWRFEILSSLLEYQLIGLQTLRDRRNLLQCLRTLFQRVSSQGKGQVMTIQVQDDRLVGGERSLRVGSFPIGIDCHSFEQRAASAEVETMTRQLKIDLKHRQIILGVDRLDYTKGLPNRLKAFKNALARFPDLRRQVTFVQYVVPSREVIPAYHSLHLDVEHLVSEINGEFSEPGWVPIHYFYRSLSPVELAAYYRAASIALVTPLKDGMNLVAKEYCSAQVDAIGVLILSEFAGAAAALQKGALLVNPYDIEGMAGCIQQALHLSVGERRERMQRLQKIICDYDVFRWVDNFLSAAIGKDLSNFPPVADYFPLLNAADRF